MKIKWQSACALIALLLVAVFSGTSPESIAAGAGGASSEIPAYYDGQLFTINLLELSDNAAARIIASNQNLNTIFATNDLDDPQDLNPVITAIPGDGFNPMWLQVLIQWNPGFTPHQFTSDEEVQSAASGAHPEITLVTTDEVYRCSVVGRK